MTITLPFNPGRKWYLKRRDSRFTKSDYEDFCVNNPHVAAEWNDSGEITIRLLREMEPATQS